MGLEGLPPVRVALAVAESKADQMRGHRGSSEHRHVCYLVALAYLLLQEAKYGNVRLAESAAGSRSMLAARPEPHWEMDTTTVVPL